MIGILGASPAVFRNPVNHGEFYANCLPFSLVTHFRFTPEGFPSTFIRIFKVCDMTKIFKRISVATAMLFLVVAAKAQVVYKDVNPDVSDSCSRRF